MIRLGGIVAGLPATRDPVVLARSHAEFGYTASNAPYDISIADTAYLRSYREAFAAQDVAIAEVGVWKNIIAPEDDLRAANFAYACERLAIADELGATCCINWMGSVKPGERRGPHPDNLNAIGFERTVESIRKLIDTVKPKRTKYTLEIMQFLLPDSAQSYLDLIKAIDRPQFAVHLDPVNCILTPRMFFANSSIIKECFDLLGPWIVSCHAKDIVMGDGFGLRLDEAIPGTGNLDYEMFLRQIARLPGDMPLMMEHLQESEYAQGRDHILAVAKRIGVEVRVPKAA
jgi:sugar phosphate isomerase/epimerase